MVLPRVLPSTHGSASEQHPPASPSPWWCGAPGSPLTSSTCCFPMAFSLCDCPKSAMSSGGQGAERAVSRCWSLGGSPGGPHTLLSPERGSQHCISPSALQLKVAVSAWHISPFQLSLSGHCVTQHFCSQEKLASPQAFRGPQSKGVPPCSMPWVQARGRMFPPPPWQPSPRQMRSWHCKHGIGAGAKFPSTVLPLSLPGLTLSMPHGLTKSCVSTQYCVIVPWYLRDTRPQSHSIVCQPQICCPLPASRG